MGREKNSSVFIGQWCYTKPDLIPKENGDIIIIKKVSFGPLEVYEWGIDYNHIPYAYYQWVENDFDGNNHAENDYAGNDCSGNNHAANNCAEKEKNRRMITREELLAQVNSEVLLFKENALSEWVMFYEKILHKCFETGR